VPPSGPVPEKGVPQGADRLLRNNVNKFFTTLDGATRVDPFMAVPCCMGWAKVENQRWPLASEGFMDETGKFGADMFHFRLGPWFGNAENESEWADIGGAYAADGSWNAAYWEKVRSLTWHAFKAGAYVEVVAIDSWWLKGATGKDVQSGKMVPWPEADVRAYGVTMTPVQEALIRKTVTELGCFGNVIWATGNEEDLIPRMTGEYLNRLIEVTRDEETKSGCNFGHVFGTGSLKGVNADYQISHERSPVTGPCNGKLCVNNEHNPEFSPEEEASLFSQARAAGQVWAAWRAGADDAAWEKRLELFREIVGGTAPPTGCFAPPPDDPLWVQTPVDPSVRPAQMMAAINEAKARVGNRCGATAPCTYQPCAPPVHLGCLETNALVAEELRKAGNCATGPWVDATAVLAPDGLWEEYHICSTGDGCYTGNPYKFAWKYGGTNPTPGPTPPPAGECPVPVPTVDEVLCKLHQPGQGLYDCTPKANGQPILPEGHPDRAACEKAAMGGAYPTYQLSQASATLTLSTVENPMMFRIQGAGSGFVTCVTPSSAGANVCKGGDTTLEQGVPVQR
jgi:hypothetical protein